MGSLSGGSILVEASILSLTQSNFQSNRPRRSVRNRDGEESTSSSTVGVAKDVGSSGNGRDDTEDATDKVDTKEEEEEAKVSARRKSARTIRKAAEEVVSGDDKMEVEEEKEEVSVRRKSTRFGRTPAEEALNGESQEKEEVDKEKETRPVRYEE